MIIPSRTNALSIAEIESMPGLEITHSSGSDIKYLLIADPDHNKAYIWGSDIINHLPDNSTLFLEGSRGIMTFNEGQLYLDGKRIDANSSALHYCFAHDSELAKRTLSRGIRIVYDDVPEKLASQLDALPLFGRLQGPALRMFNESKADRISFMASKLRASNEFSTQIAGELIIYGGLDDLIKGLDCGFAFAKLNSAYSGSLQYPARQTYGNSHVIPQRS